LVDRCAALSQASKYTEAIAACDLALKSDSDWGTATPALAWYNKGVALKKLGQYQEAIASYDQALAISPTDATAWTEHGVLLSVVGKPALALASQQFAVKISPNYSQALANQCAAFNKLGQFKEAQEPCEKALQGDGKWGETSPAFAWDQRGNALAGQGNYEEALASHDRAIGLNPDYAEAWNNRSVTLWFWEDTQKPLFLAIAPLLSILTMLRLGSTKAGY
jgi:tetratricopeptide (TPR) repeat protein